MWAEFICLKCAVVIFLPNFRFYKILIIFSVDERIGSDYDGSALVVILHMCCISIDYALLMILSDLGGT
jgi:hypothetical protein